MSLQDPDLESRLRNYGAAVRSGLKVTPELQRTIQSGYGRSTPIVRRRLLPQAAVALALIVVGLVTAAIVQRVRDTQLAQAMPRITTISPAPGSIDVPTEGQIRIAFVRRPAALPKVVRAPADGQQGPPHWEGNTLVISYAGLRPSVVYRFALSAQYSSSLGGNGNFGRRWSFSTEMGPPPAGIPLIWYSTVAAAGTQPSTGTQVALDWSGRMVGELHEPHLLSQTPDGSSFFVPDVGIADAQGNRIAQPLSTVADTWSDDSRQACEIEAYYGQPPSSGFTPTSLFIGPISGPIHRVADFGSLLNSQVVSVLACSVLTDRAVVAQRTLTGFSEVRAIKLSTGATLFDRSYYPPLAGLIASRDGAYLAGVRSDGTTIITSTGDGRVMARLPNQKVTAFSWDGTLVITAPTVATGNSDRVELVDWQHAKTVWQLSLASSTEATSIVRALAQPGGSSMVVTVGRLDRSGVAQDLWLVHSNGSAQKVVSGPIVPGW